VCDPTVTHAFTKHSQNVPRRRIFMNQKIYSVLIVDDDRGIREALFEILQLKGYKVSEAATGLEGIEQTKTQMFDIILIDIQLPDIEGTELLVHFQKATPEAIKIMITGNSTVENALEALNKGANSYFKKPFNPQDLLETIENKLQERERRERITGKRLEEWVKLRLRRSQSSEFEEFANRASSELGIFGLNKTQAKLYVALNVLGAASASEVALLTKIRREEVYRLMPELEKKGLVANKFENPKRFAAIEPKIAIENLATKRIKILEEETMKLGLKKVELITQLENASFKVDEEKSTESLSEHDNVQKRLLQLTQKAKQHIEIATISEDLETPFLKLITSIPPKIDFKIRLIIDGLETCEEKYEYTNSDQIKIIISRSRSETSTIEIRNVKSVPFNLLLVDNAEAVWGDFQSKNSPSKVLWTNDPIQVDILRRAFENLWQEAQRLKA
jgi:DNA-binding response OmpR family regulator